MPGKPNIKWKEGDLKNAFQKHQNSEGSNFDQPFNKMVKSGVDASKNLIDCNPGRMSRKHLEAIFHFIDTSYKAGLSRYISRSAEWRKIQPVNISTLNWLIFHKLTDSEINFISSSLVCKKWRTSFNTDEFDPSLIIRSAAIIASHTEGIQRSSGGPISFCSKLSFFFNGMTPIFDKYASSAASQIAGQRKKIPHSYAKHCDRVFEIMGVICNTSTFTPKQLKDVDGFLMEYGIKREQQNQQAKKQTNSK